MSLQNLNVQKWLLASMIQMSFSHRSFTKNSAPMANASRCPAIVLATDSMCATSPDRFFLLLFIPAILMGNPMKTKFMAAGFIAGLLLTGSALAQVAVTGDVGTTGLGLHLSVPLQTSLNARVGFNYLNYSYSGNTSDVNYDFKLKLKTLDALLDWFPMNGAFRVSGGIVYNGNKIDAIGKSNSNGIYTLNGNTYTAANAGTINGNIDFRKAAPYLGIGWGNALAKDKGWGLSGDIGVLLQGSPHTALTSSGCTSPIAGQCSQLTNDVAAENVKLRDKVNSFKAYPVLRAGVSYKF